MQIGDARAQRHVVIKSHHVHEMVHGGGAFGRFNTWVAVRITRAVGSMPVAYLFALLALVSLPAAINSHNTIIIVSWIAQTFLQLVLLPIIIVGQNVQAASSDARAEADHETLTAVHVLSREIHTLTERVQQINQRQTSMLEMLTKEEGAKPATE